MTEASTALGRVAKATGKTPKPEAGEEEAREAAEVREEVRVRDVTTLRVDPRVKIPPPLGWLNTR